MRHFSGALVVALLASAIAGANVAIAQQGMTCAQLKQEYAAALPPKAWAESANARSCGFASAKSASTLAEARERALGYCANRGNPGCHVTSSAGK